MATPTVYGVTEGAGASDTAHTITFTQTTGDRVVIFLANNSTARTWSLGDSFVNLTNTSATFHIFTKVLDGSEGGNMVATAGVATKSAWLAYNITTGTHASGTAPVFSTVATGTSTAPNSGSLSPSGGSATYLWLSAFGMAGEEADDDTWCNSAPSTPGTFTGLVQKTCGTAGAVTLNCEVAAAQYASETATVDPGAFDTDQSLAWRAYTVAIYPATAVFKEVYPGCASGTGAAYQPVPKPAPSAGHAAGTGTAYEPSRYAMALLALGPVSYWRLNEATPGTGTAVDAMGANDGTYVASPTGGVTGALTGDSDKAVTFNGSTQRVGLPSGTSLSATTSVTVAAWIKRNGTPAAGERFFDRRELYAVKGYEISATTDGYIQWFVGDGSNYWVAATTTNVCDNAWHFVVSTRDVDGVYVYVDGAEVYGDAAAAASVGSMAGTTTATIGALYTYDPATTQYWEGSLDEVAVWTRALSATEVFALYVVGRRAAAAGHASGTGAAYAPTISTGKSVDAGLAAATGAAYSPPIKYAPVGLASGVGAANAPPAKVAPNAAHAPGTGSAYQPVANPKPNAGVAAATGSAYGPPIKYVPAGLASGTGAAYSPTLTCASNANAGHAAGTGAAYGPPIKYVPAGHAAGTGAAYTPTLTCASNAPAGHASGTGAAYGPPIKYVLAGHAAGAGAAYGASETVAPSAGLAEGTGTAYEPTVETGGAPATSVYPDCASGSGAAGSPTATVAPSAGAATGTGAAYAPTLTCASNANAGHAAGTGAAYGPTLTCASNANAGHAAGTGAAYNPPFGAPAGLASGTGSAYQPTLTILSNAPAGHAAGTGAAFGASETVAPNAGTAAATGAAYSPPIKYVLAGLAAATGAAYSPTLTCASNAPAGHAAATGAAYEPTVETGGTFAPAGCAEGTGAAYEPTVTASPSVFAWCDAATGTGAAYGATLPTISGVTRDENGSAIPLCTVDAFVSSTNAYYATTTSDALGRYSIIVAPGVDYFLVAYTLVGDVYGVTARDLSA